MQIRVKNLISEGSACIGMDEVLRREAKEIHGANLEHEHAGTELYVALNRLHSAALCLSGGGIRSAAFALGVIQALAVPRLGRSRGRGSAPPGPDQSLLPKFHYLSTVSGGGYMGSWLSAWRLSQPFPEIWRRTSLH
jgi:predicted acylesterase/phospholipase RssA